MSGIQRIPAGAWSGIRGVETLVELAGCRTGVSSSIFRAVCMSSRGFSSVSSSYKVHSFVTGKLSNCKRIPIRKAQSTISRDSATLGDTGQVIRWGLSSNSRDAGCSSSLLVFSCSLLRNRTSPFGFLTFVKIHRHRRGV